jgi:hypothetical protein
VDAAKAFDTIVAAVKEGNAGFADVANYMPKVIPMARAIGLELGETAGAFAQLTKSLKPEAAATALEGMMRALSNSNDIKNFKGLGIKIFDADTGQIRSITAIIEDLNKSMTGLTDEQKMEKFSKLGLDQSATLAVSSMMQNVDDLKKTVDATTQSTGALERAFNDAKTPMDSWRTIGNLIQVSMIKIGEVFLPVVQTIGESILNTINYFKDLYRESDLFRGLLFLIGDAFKTTFAIATAPIRAVIYLIRRLGTSITWAWEKLKEFGVVDWFKKAYNTVRPILIYISELVSQVGSILYDVFTLNVSDAYDKIKNFKLPQMDDIRQRIKDEEKQNEPEGDFAGVEQEKKIVVEGVAPKETNVTDDAHKITGQSQTKSITVNIDAFIKGFNPTSQIINNMNPAELEHWMNEMFLRVIRSADTM